MKKKNEKKPMLIPPPLNIGFPIVADPMGMYSGVTQEPFEAPVQDADDL